MTDDQYKDLMVVLGGISQLLTQLGIMQAMKMGASTQPIENVNDRNIAVVQKAIQP